MRAWRDVLARPRAGDRRGLAQSTGANRAATGSTASSPFDLSKLIVGSGGHDLAIVTAATVGAGRAAEGRRCSRSAISTRLLGAIDATGDALALEPARSR
jgi:hypothetical protein